MSPVTRHATGQAWRLNLSDLEPRDHDGSHLTLDQVRHLEAYVAKVLLALDLNYWRVHIARDLPPEDARLMIWPTDGRRIAMLYVSADWWDVADATEKRVEITHECLHLAHHDQEEVFRRFRNDNGDIGPYAMSLVWDQFKVETERMVDSLSYVLAPHMPKWTRERTS